MRTSPTLVAGLLLASFAAPPVFAEIHREFSGLIAMEPRWFWNDNLAAGQRGDGDFSLVLQPEVYG